MKVIEKERASEILNEAVLVSNLLVHSDETGVEKYMLDGIEYVLTEEGDLIEVDEDFNNESVEDIEPASEESLDDAELGEQSL